MLHTFQAWSGTLWGAINVEGLMEECKQLTKDMKQLPKAVSLARWWWGQGRSQTGRHTG